MYERKEKTMIMEQDRDLVEERAVMNGMMLKVGTVIEEGGGEGDRGLGAIVYLLTKTKGKKWVERLGKEIVKSGEFDFDGFRLWRSSRKKQNPCQKRSRKKIERSRRIKMRENLTDVYIRRLLSERNGILRGHIPQGLIELKRVKLRLDRKLKEEFGKEFR